MHVRSKRGEDMPLLVELTVVLLHIEPCVVTLADAFEPSKRGKLDDEREVWCRVLAHGQCIK